MPLSGIGFGEMLLIAMLVLIVFGPRRLPEITRSLGKAMREFKRGMNEIQRELEIADREERWSRPGSGSADGAGGTGRALAAAGVAGTAKVERPAADADGGESPVTDGEASPAAASQGKGRLEAEEGPLPESGPPVLEDEKAAPPTPTPGFVDPAEEFIDPWSTDSSSFQATRPRPATPEPEAEGEEPREEVVAEPVPDGDAET